MGDAPFLAVTIRLLEAGGTQVAEANKVISDLTIGSDGVETPLPNHFPASTVHQ